MSNPSRTATDFDTTFLTDMSRRVLIGDGAMGTMLQAADLTLDDFNNLEGCNEILNDTRPDVLADIHRAYFCLLYTSPSPRDQRGSRMPSSA